MVGADLSSPAWRVARKSFAADMARGCVPVLCVSAAARPPPYQPVVFFRALVPTLSDRPAINPRAFDWVVKSGRAVIYPVYTGTLERGDDVTRGDYPTMATRIATTSSPRRDLRRTLDYLETRPDIVRDRIGFMGLSWDAAMARCSLRSSLDSARGAPRRRVLHAADAARSGGGLCAARRDARAHDQRAIRFFLPEARTQIPMFRSGHTLPQKRRVVYQRGTYSTTGSHPRFISTGSIRTLAPSGIAEFLIWNLEFVNAFQILNSQFS